MGHPPERVPPPAADADGDGLAGRDTFTEFHSPPPSRRLEVACAVVVLGLCVALLIGARGIEVRTETGGIDPRWWPQLLGMAGIALSLLLLGIALVRPPQVNEDLSTVTATGARRLGLALVGSAALVMLWPVVGFVPAGAVFVATLTALFGGRGWRTLLLFPALLTAFLYVLFAALLEVPL